ncbi:unnamed protein product [Moneuplotes crassus]|uniref:Uncharacterized protein n=1 Tax=Euplotes crassus TaxID=5936 RepID=A0AAD1Y550_EUPCR|nr:unnamed protein product [Moneuplotes crassus]
MDPLFNILFVGPNLSNTVKKECVIKIVADKLTHLTSHQECTDPFIKDIFKILLLKDLSVHNFEMFADAIIYACYSVLCRSLDDLRNKIKFEQISRIQDLVMDLEIFLKRDDGKNDSDEEIHDGIEEHKKIMYQVVLA